MDRGTLTEHVAAWMKVLCVDIGPRHPGSPGNRRATDFLEATLRSFGLEPYTMEFDAWIGKRAMRCSR